MCSSISISFRAVRHSSTDHYHFSFDTMQAHNTEVEKKEYLKWIYFFLYFFFFHVVIPLIAHHSHALLSLSLSLFAWTWIRRGFFCFYSTFSCFWNSEESKTRNDGRRWMSQRTNERTNECNLRWRRTSMFGHLILLYASRTPYSITRAKNKRCAQPIWICQRNM